MAVTGDPPRTDLGYMSDHTGWSATFADMLETVPDLTWPESVRTYAKMRTDPQIAGVLASYTLPLRQAHLWAVDPAGCRDEVVQLVADDLGIPILGVDPEPGPARRRGVRWEEHLRLALLHLVFGHMPFTQRYDIVGQRARLVELAERMPSTITQIDIDDVGKLVGILQFGAEKEIPARYLVWYVHEREGAAWQGRSMLRPAYGPWLLKHEMWRVHATSIRRFGMGVPTVEGPPGGTPAQVVEAQRLASSMRVGDQSGAGLPNGFKFNLTGLTGSVPDALGFIRYLDQQMAQMALSSVLNLDASPNGSRALGETFVDLLLTSLNAISGEMANTATGLAVQMVDYNWGEDEPAPRIVCGDVGSRPEVTAEAIAGLLSSGAISPDPALEAWVRERWRLPGREEPAPATTPPPPPAPNEPPPDNPPPPTTTATRKRRTRRKVTAATGAVRRQLTLVEATAGLDPDAVQADWETALNRLLRQWTTINAARRQQLAEQVAALIDDGDIVGLGNLDVDSTDAAVMLADAMTAAASDSAERLADEAATQGVQIDTGDVTIDPAPITAAAKVVAAITGSGLASAAGREALRVATPASTGAQVAAAVNTHLTDLSDAYLREQLGGALTMAQNTGRLAVLDTVDDEPQLVASEILDNNICEACLQIDGHEFASRDAAAEAYANGGYISCYGRLRCRGIVVAVWGNDG